MEDIAHVIDHLVELHKLLIEARGDHPALAAVRKTIAAAIDAQLNDLDVAGYSANDVLDAVDARVDLELAGEFA